MTEVTQEEREAFKNKWEKEIYLGDGVYVKYDGYHIEARAPRPGGDHIIRFEPQLLEAFWEYEQALRHAIRKLMRTGEYEIKQTG
jgi:hypothetical protein